MTKTIADSSGLAHGIGLFNRAHFFDAHEALEDVWRPALRGSSRRRHLQGLVQLAVAFHHQSRDNFIGAQSVLDRGCRNLATAEDSFPEIDFARLRPALAHWQRYLASASSQDHPSRQAQPKETRPEEAHAKSARPKNAPPRKEAPSRPALPRISMRRRARLRPPAKISDK